MGTWFRMKVGCHLLTAISFMIRIVAILLKEDLVVSLRSCIDSYLAFENAADRPDKQYSYQQAKER